MNRRREIPLGSAEAELTSTSPIPSPSPGLAEVYIAVASTERPCSRNLGTLLFMARLRGHGRGSCRAERLYEGRAQLLLGGLGLVCAVLLALATVSSQGFAASVSAALFGLAGSGALAAESPRLRRGVRVMCA